MENMCFEVLGDINPEQTKFTNNLLRNGGFILQDSYVKTVNYKIGCIVLKTMDDLKYYKPYFNKKGLELGKYLQLVTVDEGIYIKTDDNDVTIITPNLFK